MRKRKRKHLLDYFVCDNGIILLFANSPLPPHARAGLDNMTLPPPFKNFLLQYQDGTNAVVQKQEEIGAVRFDRNLILNGVIRYGLNNDSVPEAKDSLVTILENETDYTAKYTLIPLLINMARYDDAAGQIADLQSLAANLPTREQEYALDYAGIQTITLQLDSMHATDSVSMAPVVAPNEPLLSSVANDPNHPAKKMDSCLRRNEMRMSIKTLPASIYFVKIETNKGTVVKKFVKQ